MKTALRHFAFTLVLAAPIATIPALASQLAPIQNTDDFTIDVRNGDQKGKLMLKSTELIFESLSDSRHSRRWKYADIRELSKRGSKELRVRPNQGDRYDFQFSDKKDRERLHDMISSRIVASRAGAK